MYADRHAGRPAIKPGSMTLALAMTALPIVGLITSTQASRIIAALDPPITILTVPPVKDPPLDPPKQKTKAADPIDQKIYVPPVDLPPLDHPRLDTTPTFPPFPPPPLPPGAGTAIKAVTPPPPPAVMVNAEYDPRYAYALQPTYPTSEIRAGNSGRVVLRVLIGPDGRVKQVERVSAASDAFFAAAEHQALTRWRFKPATRDGVAIEQWKTMSLSFVLDEQ
ncbi:TonB family protein [Sphingomonas sp.]|uniref:energy transducer TonB n=1 Tax=Sphingomonas sp. TaxID=28214 RepID=UPI002E35E569|nr:TonB family protein [Sphingomonas sp.]HEX4695158.1 TonB family protein [Sphingomonas sp.]